MKTKWRKKNGKISAVCVSVFQKSICMRSSECIMAAGQAVNNFSCLPVVPSFFPPRLPTCFLLLPQILALCFCCNFVLLCRLFSSSRHCNAAAFILRMYMLYTGMSRRTRTHIHSYTRTYVCMKLHKYFGIYSCLVEQPIWTCFTIQYHVFALIFLRYCLH